MAIEWVLLDAGNTLLGLDYGRLIRALAEAGLDVTEDSIRRAEGEARPALERLIFSRWIEGEVPRSGWIEARVWADFWGEVLRRAGAEPSRVEPLVQATLRVTRPAANWNRITPGASAVLESLAGSGVRLGVVSNSDGSVAAQLAALGLAGRFEFILDSTDAGVEKPHPEIFRIALGRAGLADASRAIYVGDVYSIDVAGAAGAGIHPVLFDPDGLWNRGDFLGAGPDCHVLRAMADLPELVRVLART